MAIGPDRTYATRGATTAADIDVGLRQYMLRVYNYMTGGLAVTGLIAYFASTSATVMQTIYGTPLAWVVMLAPLGFVLLLRFAPARVLDAGSAIWSRVLPEAASQRLRTSLEHLADGLRGLRGGAPLAWVCFYSLVLWLVIAVIPFSATLWSLHSDLGSGSRMLLASDVLLRWVGAAVAIPSAPGFFGPYHAACWVALSPFGVPKEMAIALGTLAHGVFWLTTTLTGLFVLRRRGAPLPDLDAVAPE